MNKVRTFNVECTMEERWVPYFAAFLKQMQYNGNIGHSSVLAMYADGNGDFHPSFNIQTDYYLANPSVGENTKKPPEYVYDAG